jgi:hypothetical protein
VPRAVQAVRATLIDGHIRHKQGITEAIGHAGDNVWAAYEKKQQGRDKCW